MKTYLITLLFLIPILYMEAQQDSLQEHVQFSDRLENLLETLNDETNISEDLLEQLDEWETQTNHRPNINKLSYEVAIEKLHLNDYQYYQLQKYIEEYGALASIYELKIIDGFSAEDVARLSKLVRVENPTGTDRLFDKFFKKSKSSLLIRYQQVVERQAGYDTSRSNHYAGSPAHACFKYTFNVQNRIIMKISGEKDPGEQFFRGEQSYGFDFYSGSMHFQRFGIMKSAVLGDYRLNFGQGMVLGSSLLSGKGSGPDDIRRFSSGIRAIAPTNEGTFLRGGAVTLGKTNYNTTVFYGRRFSSLNQAMGLNFDYQQALFKVGIRVIGISTADTTLQDTKTIFRSYILPTTFNAAVDHQFLFKRVILFGETAIDSKGHFGTIQSLLAPLSPTSKLALIIRHYSKAYQSPLGSPFRASSDGISESGCYLTSSHILSRRFEVRLYGDYYLLHEPSYRTDAPTTGIDLGCSGLITLSRSSRIMFGYSFRDKSENGETTTPTRPLREHQRHKYRLQLYYRPLPQVVSKTEIHGVTNTYKTEKKRFSGFLIFQDIALQFQKPGLSIHLRAAYFSTDRYDERLYAYEDDVYYAFTIGSYYYTGIRGYLVIRWHYRWFSVWLRAAQTHYLDRNTISSGLTQIDKPHKTEIKLQTIFSF